MIYFQQTAMNPQGILVSFYTLGLETVLKTIMIGH